MDAQEASEDNTVGSLSKEQRSLIIGSLLGDGAMRCKTNALIEFNHGADQRDYVDWKYSRLSNLVGTPPSCETAMAVASLIGSPPEVWLS